MSKTPAQARFNKLKLIYEHANHERLAHQQKHVESKADFLPTHDTANPAADTGKSHEQANVIKNGLKK